MEGRGRWREITCLPTRHHATALCKVDEPPGIYKVEVIEQLLGWDEGPGGGESEAWG